MVGTAYAHGYDNSNISLYNNILTGAVFNLIGLQNTRLTNLSGDISIYQSQVTDGTLYNFPVPNTKIKSISGNINSILSSTIVSAQIEPVNLNELSSNSYSYISSLYINNIPSIVNWSGLLVNGGDRLYFDKNVHHMYKNIKENYVFNTISDELINYLPKNLNRIKCYI